MAPTHNVQPGVQTASFWIDESGSKGSANKCYVVAGIKTRHPDDLQREIQTIRDRTGYPRPREFKFGRISKSNYARLHDLVDVLAASDAHIVATVVDGTYNPFVGQEQWLAHSKIIARLIVGNLNSNEVADAHIDGITTPPGKSLGRAVKRSVNQQLRTTALTHAVSLDSKSNDLLQAADLVAGAIRNQRLGGTPSGSQSSEKAVVAARLAAAFGVPDLSDGRSSRVNIKTLQRATPRRRSLRLVQSQAPAS